MPAPVLKALASKAGVSKERAEKLWAKAKERAEAEGHKDDYAYIVGTLKRMLGLDKDTKGESGGVSSPDFPLLLEVWGREGAAKLLTEEMSAGVKAALQMRWLEIEKQVRAMGRGKVNWETLARTLRLGVYTLLNWLASPDRPEESFKKYAGII